jgi:hypothetical protein
MSACVSCDLVICNILTRHILTVCCSNQRMMRAIESCRAKKKYVDISRCTQVQGYMYPGTARYNDFTILG